MAAAQLTTPAATPVPRPRRTWLLAGGVLFGLLLAGGLAAGTIPRLTRDRAVRDQTAANAARPPRVAVATATRVAPDAVRVRDRVPKLDIPEYRAAVG